MAARSHEHDLSGAPAGERGGSWLTRWAKVGFGLTSRPAATADAAQVLDLTRARAVMEDGLLMVFGPDGDPIPPGAFAAAARPGAEVSLPGGQRVPAERVADVLEAQTRGRLGSGQGGDEAWVMAMLGLGSQPEAATEADLEVEERPCELTVFGADLMLSLPAGRTFLLAEARTPASSCARLYAPEGAAVTVADLVSRLRTPAEGAHGTDDSADDVPSSEIRLTGCMARLQDDALVFEVPGLGALHLGPVHDPVTPAPLISIFQASGEAATVDDLLRALSPPSDRPAEALPAEPEVAEPEVAEPEVAEPEVASGPAADPAEPQQRQALNVGGAETDTPRGLPETDAAPGLEVAAPADGPAPSRPIGLAIALPGSDLGDVAMVVIGGLGQGALLSAGIDNGDGSWSLAPQDLIGLSLALPPMVTSDQVIEVRAIAVENRDGELVSASKTIRVPALAGEAGSGPAGIPVVVDPDLLRQGGSVDAILVRDLPPGAGLSVGTHDPAIDAWVLLPGQLGQLAVTPPRAPTEDFTLTLMGIALKPAGPARVLARIPIAAG